VARLARTSYHPAVPDRSATSQACEATVADLDQLVEHDRRPGEAGGHTAAGADELVRLRRK
jgi:hypothetical protein